jgi:hypothetical protein
MPPQISDLSVGQTIGSIPPGEGLLPVLNGPSFDVIGFYSDLSSKNVKEWQQGKLRYGLFVRDGIPIVLIDLGRTWRLDIHFNILQEAHDIRRAFFEGDPEATGVHLALASHPSVVVLAKRSFHLDPSIMMRIKEACFTQLSAYSSAQECSRAIDRIYAREDSRTLRKKARS